MTTVIIIYTKDLVTAADQCTETQFATPFFPGESCEGIYNNNPQSHNSPGYYWILNGPSRVYCAMNYTGSSCEDIYNNNPEISKRSGYYRISGNQWTYCNVTAIDIIASNFISTCAGVGGQWRRFVDIDISVGDNCPSGWTKATFSSYSFCQKSFDGQGCSSTVFNTNGIAYQKVCGKARGYQKGHAAFPWGSFLSGSAIDDTYVEGLSITYGSPRQHIWTYATGEFDNGRIHCPCDGTGGTAPSFVGSNYYCESGQETTDNHAAYYFNDPLWDGLGCIHSNCCSVPNQPWFYRQLNEITSANIEVRLCVTRSFSAGFTMIDQLEIYIQ